MPDLEDQIQSVKIEEELSKSYLDYAMSVIVGRALPDVRDGLKPVHRRVLFAMSELNNTYSRAYVKSARVVGEVIGKYHPHGDSAVYDTIVRMAQDFSMRELLVDGQGNFGSVDGDSPAAQRYTEVRMTRFANLLLEDLDKDTVPFVPNYDDTLQMPVVLPNRVPNLLVNGSSGIAVGMATNIPPHNTQEVVAACLHLLDNPEADIEELMQFIQGPDFPTGAMINGRAGILAAYRTGRGSILIRSKTEIIADERGKETILVHEIPYQVNKAEMIIKIAALVKDKKLEGISEIRDESDKDGLRVVIEIKRTDSAEVVLNNLYAKSDLERSYGINLVALVDHRPQQLNLCAILGHFLTHRREVVTRRTLFLLRQEQNRGHLLEGQAVALANIDRVVAIIRRSADADEAKVALMDEGWEAGAIASILDRTSADGRPVHHLCRPEGLAEAFGYRDGLYYLSEQQTTSILAMRLQRLTSLEQDKLLADYQQAIEAILDYQFILQDTDKKTAVIREELQAVSETYDDTRRTEIVDSQLDLEYEDLVEPQDRVVTLSHQGYAKARPLSEYEAIGRGGRGRRLAATNTEDFIAQMFVANTHDTILCFSNTGKVYWLKVYRIPLQGRVARGRPLVNLLKLGEGEHITTFLPVNEYRENHFVFMATAQGRVKKTALTSFARQRSSGLIALALKEGDTLVNAAITDGRCDIALFSSAGKMTRFKESEVRAVGRTAAGVKGMRIPENQRIVSMVVPQADHHLLIVSENGYGKRSAWDLFPMRHRATKGLRAILTSERNGQVVTALQVAPTAEAQIALLSERGRLVRTNVDGVSLQGRSTQGVNLIRLEESDRLVSVVGVLDDQDDDEPDAP